MVLWTQQSENIVNAAWRGLVAAQNVVTALESIGLDVDGTAAKGGAGANGLYGAIGACCDVLREAWAIPSGTPWSEQVDMYLATAAPKLGKDSPLKMPAQARTAMDNIRNTMEAASVGSPEGLAPYEVTVSATGGVTVYASGREDAMSRLAAMDDGEAAARTAWDGITATDAYEQ